MHQLKKDITFIYSDSAEKAIYEPIAEEAKKRGYQVTLTDDKFAKCEIGFYCQHINFPQFSRFSFIMLHDILQQYGKWPDLWLREPWNKYDIGILPSKQWENNWNACSKWYYANPRIGMYRIGWPKADVYAKMDRAEYRKAFNAKYGLDDSKKTILYAPAWENDNKQDDFVQAMLKLDVNILIKHAPFEPDYSPEYKAAYDEVNRMYELHKDLPRVTILHPKTNIFDVIMACDVLVSEESSTMCEAVMMGIPAISVSDWLIPDTIPHRLPICNYDFVMMTMKDNLTAFVADMLDHYEETLTQVNAFRERTFGEVGGCAEKIMDIVDDCVMNRPIRYDRLEPQPKEHLPFKKQFFHVKEGIKRELYHNYNQRFGWFHKVYEPTRKLKKHLEGRE